jgi:pimeloyl-ACP methyl ester carboxylesterase
MKKETIYKTETGEKALMKLYDRVLAAWGFPFEPLRIKTRYGETFVIAAGKASAPPLVLLHGSGSNSLTWLGDIPVYAKEFRVYAVDILGEAGKSDAHRLPWESPAYGEWLDDLLKALSLSRVMLVGLSLGGWTALKYAVQYSGGVKKLVLISPGGIVPGKFLVNFKLIFLSLLGKWGQARVKKLVFGNQPITQDAEEAFDLLNKYYYYRMGTPPLFSDTELMNLKVPVLFLGDIHDLFFHTSRAVERMEKLIPRFTSRVSSDKGHGLINTAPLIMPFLLE